MTNVKRKGLVYALILTLCLGVIPFNVASFQAAAETKNKTPAVTAKTYSKKAAGKYGELDIPAGHKCYLVEFNGNPEYDYALYDYDTNEILYPEIKKAEEKTKSADAEKQEAENNTETVAPEKEGTAASAE